MNTFLLMKLVPSFRLLLNTTLLLLPFSLFAQDPCSCCTENHQQFDFWVGDWVVHDTAGVLQGENTITKLENGCILNEHWRGASGSTGRSYNYYDRSDSTWNQLWIDNSGSNLILKGYATKDQMILSSAPQQSKKGDTYQHRITWTVNADETVSQLWETIGKKGQVLKVIFLGIYSKKQ